LFVAGFIGSPKMNFIEGKLIAATEKTSTVQLADGNKLEASVDARDGQVGAKVTVGIRPEHWKFDVSGNSINGEVIAVENLGESTVLYLQAVGALGHIVVRADASHAAKAGEKISVHLPPERCYLFNEAGVAFRRV
jgi:multiple sugar transport system ATP-binding protein